MRRRISVARARSAPDHGARDYVPLYALTGTPRGRKYPEAGTARANLAAVRNMPNLPKEYGTESIWRACREGKAGPVFSAWGESHLRWIENPAAVGLRLVGLSHNVPANTYRGRAVDHDGWFLDSEIQDETVSGVVYRLPGKDGRARYLAGYADPWNADKDGRGPALLSLDVIEGEPVDSSWETDSALVEAARAGDSIAERMAEHEREYQDAFRAGSAARDVSSAATEAGKLWIETLRELRDACAMLRHVFAERWTAIREDVPVSQTRAWVRAEIRDIRTLRERADAERETWEDKRADAYRARRDSPGAWNASARDSFWEGYREGGL